MIAFLPQPPFTNEERQAPRGQVTSKVIQTSTLWSGYLTLDLTPKVLFILESLPFLYIHSCVGNVWWL